jgi:hypothetical protein
MANIITVFNKGARNKRKIYRGTGILNEIFWRIVSTSIYNIAVVYFHRNKVVIGPVHHV